MMDWYLGQAGFGEQLERYGDAYWRQMGGTVLWAFIAIWALLVFVAIIVAVARQAEIDEQTGGGHTSERVLGAAHRGALVPKVRTARSARPLSEAPSANRVVPPKVA